MTWAAGLDGKMMMPPQGSLLNEPMPRRWTWFATLTFRKPTPMHRAHCAWDRLRRWLSSLAWFPLEDSPCSLLLWSVEPHETGNAHIHALLAHTHETSVAHCARCRNADRRLWKRLNESWYKHHGIARFRPYDSGLAFGAERYVVKYVLDNRWGDQVDWGVWEHGIDYAVKGD